MRAQLRTWCNRSCKIVQDQLARSCSGVPATSRAVSLRASHLRTSMSTAPVWSNVGRDVSPTIKLCIAVQMSFTQPAEINYCYLTQHDNNGAISQSRANVIRNNGAEMRSIYLQSIRLYSKSFSSCANISHLNLL